MFNSCPLLAGIGEDTFQDGTETIKKINVLISKLPQKSPERLLACQWVTKLKRSDAQSSVRDHYIQLLFSQLSYSGLSNPFLEQPPNQPLPPLATKQSLFSQNSITPPLPRHLEATQFTRRRSYSNEMSIPFHNGNSNLTPPSRHRHTNNMTPSLGYEDLLDSTERLLSKTKPPDYPRKYQRDGQTDTFQNSLVIDEEDLSLGQFPPLYEHNLSSPELILSDHSLGDGQVSFSTKKRHTDVTELIGGNLSAKFQGRRRMGPGSADRHLRSADRNSSGRTNQQDDSLRTILDQKNTEIESTKHNCANKLKEVVSRCRRLEERLKRCEEELGREREGNRDKIEEQRNAFDKRHSALFKEYELKMQNYVEDNETEKGDIHKQHAKKLGDVMSSTQECRLKLETEFAKQARSTNKIVQELEVRVKQLTEEVANEAKSRTRLLKEKTDLEQKVSSLRHQLDTSVSHCEDLESEKRECLSDYEASLRKLQNQLEHTIQLAKQEHTNCAQKYSTRTQELEQQLIQCRNALESSKTERQQLESKLDQLMRELRNRDSQLECKVTQAKTEIEQIESRYKQRLRKADGLLAQREEAIRELQEINNKQTQQAQHALDQFKSQFEKNSTEVYKQMKQQLEKVEQDLDTSRQVREKQSKEYVRQRELERKQSSKELEILKAKFGKERQQILKESEEARSKLELKLTEERDKILKSTQETVSRNGNEFRVKSQEDSNRIGHLECQLRECREQLTSQQSQHKSQLLELSMLREEEKQNNNRNQQNLINKFKAEIDEQRRQLEAQHLDRTHQLQEETSGRVQELESNHQGRQMRTQQKISSLESEVKYLREDLSRSKSTYEDHIAESATHHEHSLGEVRKSHEAAMWSLQQESDTNRDMATQIEKRCHQLEVESELKLSQARLRYEEKLSGLLPHSIRKELEDTIVSVKAQVASLNERCILLQEQVAKKRTKL